MHEKSLITQIAAAIRRERDRTGMSLTELAKRAGIAKSTLSQLENSSGNPSVETLWALSVALDIPFSRLVDPPRPTVTVVRAHEGAAVYSDHSNYAGTLLSSSPPNARRDIYRIDIQPGDPKHSDPHQPGTTEHVVLGSGRALVGPATDPIELNPGDYIAYPGDHAHSFEALEPNTTLVLVMEHL